MTGSDPGKLIVYDDNYDVTTPAGAQQPGMDSPDQWKR